MTDVKLHGFDQLDKQLSKLPSRVARRIAVAALRKAAKPMVVAARAKVPVKTRNLKRSIGVKAMPSKSRVLKVIIGPRIGRSTKNDGFYGHMIEFGTKHIAPQPFLRPAFDETKDEALRILGKELWAGIVKEVGKP